MKEISNQELIEIKKIELAILREVDRVCRKNNIKYSLAYGTLLGAVRHGGFIPWDDDIDIMMERTEYQKFNDIVDNELSNDYYYIDILRDKHYGQMFGKVMVKGTLMKEMSLRDNKSKSGVFIDVIPIDVVPSDATMRNKQRNIAQRIRKISYCREKYYFGQNRLKLFVYRSLGIMYKFIPKSYLYNRYLQNATQFSNNADCDCMMNLAGTIKNLVYPKCFFDEYIDIQFENEKFMAIKEYDGFLKARYGDYMKLPPKDEQVPHHFVSELNLNTRR